MKQKMIRKYACIMQKVSARERKVPVLGQAEKKIKLGENLIDQAAILDSFCSKRSIFSFKRIFSDVNAEFSDFKIDCSRSEVLSSRTVASSVCC